MQKIAALLIAVLVCLLGIQTYRAHRLRQELTPPAAQSADTTGSQETPGSARGEPGPDDGSALTSFSAAGAVEGRTRGEQDGSLQTAEGRDQDLFVADDAPGRATGAEHSPTPSPHSELHASQSARKDPGKESAAGRAASSHEAEALLERARYATERGRYASAISLLEECLLKDPSVGEAYDSLASLYHSMGMTEEEMQVCADWTAQCPDDAEAYYRQAQACEALGMNDEALDALRGFQRLSQGDLEAYPMAASLYRRLNMREEEGAVLQEWSVKTPNSPDAHRALARHYTRTGQKPAALREYQAIVSLSPENATAHRDLARAYQRQRRYQAAQTELATAMNLEPENMAIRLQLAEFYRQTANLEAARDTYYGVIVDAPDSPQAFRAQRMINNIERQLQKPPKPPKPKQPKARQS